MSQPSPQPQPRRAALPALVALLVALGALAAVFSGPRLSAADGDYQAFLPVVSHAEPPPFTVIPMPGTFDWVTGIANAGDGRLFVTQVQGQIKILHPDGTIQTFMDLSDRVIIENGEMGLFQIMFDPNYAANGYFYVTYTGTNWGLGDRWIILSRFRVSGDPNFADRNTEQRLVLVKLDDVYSFHYGGGMAFHPLNGLLYVGFGDGADELRAMDPGYLFGKLFSLDVNAIPAAPAGLQLVANDAMAVQNTQILALGLRNPWRFGIDSTSGHVYIGDVGQSAREEINLLFYGSVGVNFGWPCIEGNDFPNTDPYVVASCPNPYAFTPPIYQYDHTVGCAIVGGPVVHPQAGGSRFVFTDFCRHTISWLWNNGGAWQVDDLGELPDSAGLPTTFGQGADGSIYVGTFTTSGAIYKLLLPQP